MNEMTMIGRIMSELALQLSLNQMRAQRDAECRAERRRLAWRRLPGEFQIRSASSHCTILQLF